MLDAAPSIAPAQQSEAATLARMSRDLIEYGLGWRWTPAKVLALIDSPEHLVAVARSSRGRPVGFGALELGAAHNPPQEGGVTGGACRAHLVLLAVAPELQRQGLGRRVLSWLERCARDAGAESLTLEVRQQARGARAFYQSRGYTEAGLCHGYYRGLEHAVSMVHRLRSETHVVAWAEIEKALGWR